MTHTIDMIQKINGCIEDIILFIVPTEDDDRKNYFHYGQGNGYDSPIVGMELVANGHTIASCPLSVLTYDMPKTRLGHYSKNKGICFYSFGMHRMMGEEYTSGTLNISRLSDFLVKVTHVPVNGTLHILLREVNLFQSGFFIYNN